MRGRCKRSSSLGGQLDDRGGVGRSMTRNDMTQAECEGSFRDCERTWRSEACAAHPEVRELHMSPGVPALAPEEEPRTPSDEE